jgi:hypothetical protein
MGYAVAAIAEPVNPVLTVETADITVAEDKPLAKLYASICRLQARITYKEVENSANHPFAHKKAYSKRFFSYLSSAFCAQWKN